MILLLYELSTNESAKQIVHDLTVGMTEQSFALDVIGHIGTETYHITPAQERAFRAVAQHKGGQGVSEWDQTTDCSELALPSTKAFYAENKVVQLSE